MKTHASSSPSLLRNLVLTRGIVASFSVLCTVRVDLSEAIKDIVPLKKPSGRVYYQLDYDVIVFLGLTELKAQLGWKTKVSCESWCLVAGLLNLLLRKANAGQSSWHGFCAV